MSESASDSTGKGGGRLIRYILCGVGLILALALEAPSSAAPARPSIDREWQGVVDDYRAALQNGGTVGSSMILAQDGKVIKSEYYGFADKATGRPVDAQTIYHWASITKLFTTVAILQLRDRGKLRLDDRIIDYLPEAKQIHNPYGPMSQITLRHLLTHTSGLRSATFPWGQGKDWYPHEPANWSQVAAMMPYTEIEFPPGSKWSYSNLAMSMAGRVVEEITGDHIEDYITKNILMPLGMNRTFFDVTPYYLIPHRSSNYQIHNGVAEAGNPNVETGATKGNGGLSGPLTDLLKFWNFLLGVNDNGNYDTVLSRSSIAEMETPVIAIEETSNSVPGLHEQMGLGVFILHVPDKVHGGEIRVIGHTGSQANFLSWVYIDPQTRAAAVFAQNTIDLNADTDKSAFRRARAGLFTRILPAMRR